MHDPKCPNREKLVYRPATKALEFCAHCRAAYASLLRAKGFPQWKIDVILETYTDPVYRAMRRHCQTPLAKLL